MSPWRDRSVEENLDLLQRMKNGEFPDGSHVLRAKIDMAHGNMNMRDPIMYRIIHEPPHHRTGKEWCIYPMYDWAHGQNDAMHGVTHSLCSIEYEDHRPLYEWFLRELEIENPPRQIEFARLNLTYTVMSKRKLRRLVEEGYVDGWDDPRMPTIRGMRRRGYTPEALHDFIDRTGVSKTISASAGVMVDVEILEACVRDDLNKRSPRKLAVLDPIKVVIENYPEGQTEEFEIDNNPADPSLGTRKVPFSKVIYIESDDFREDTAAQVFSPHPRAGSALAECLLCKMHGRGQGRQREILWNSAAVMIRQHGAAMRLMAERSRERSTGFQLLTGYLQKYICMIGCSTIPIRKPVGILLPI